MRKVVHNLKQKTPHHRRLAAFGASAAVVAVMMVVWGASLPVRFAKLSETVSKTQQAAGIEAFAPAEPQYNNVATSSPTTSSNGIEISDTVDPIEAEPYFTNPQ